MPPRVGFAPQSSIGWLSTALTWYGLGVRDGLGVGVGLGPLEGWGGGGWGFRVGIGGGVGVLGFGLGYGLRPGLGLGLRPGPGLRLAQHRAHRTGHAAAAAIVCSSREAAAAHRHLPGGRELSKLEEESSRGFGQISNGSGTQRR